MCLGIASMQLSYNTDLYMCKGQHFLLYLNPFTPRASYGDINVIVTSESVDEILRCDHSNETSSALLSHSTIYILVFYKMKLGI